MSDTELEKQGRWESFLLKLGVIGELMLFFARGKRWWMAPLVMLLALAGLVLVVLQSFVFAEWNVARKSDPQKSAVLQ